MKKKMGVMSGLTNEFNISRRLRLQDTAKIFVQGYCDIYSVDEWIKKYPLVFYQAVHEGQVALTRDAHYKLKLAVMEILPAVIEDTNRKKRALIVTRGKGIHKPRM